MTNREQPSKNNTGIIRVLSVLFLLLVVVAVVGIGWLVTNINELAMETFGIPDPELTRSQLIHYSFRLFYYEDDLSNAISNHSEPVEFEISSGESVLSVTDRLQEMALIKNSKALRYYLLYSGLDTGIQAGTFSIDPSMTAIEIAHIIQDSTPKDIEFVILAGWRLEEIAASLENSGLAISEDEFITVANDAKNYGVTIPASLPVEGSLEGYLFPGSYTVDREITTQELLTLFIQNFDKMITKELRQGYQQYGLDLNQAVILSSIIQREAVAENEMSLIASVFYNRLSVGMNFESDPTVQYGIGYVMSEQSWWKNPLYLTDLEYNSQYNTYIFPGFPPGPICNPGYPALEAVAHPEQTDYLYFRAACDDSGVHNFSMSYEEHVQYACPESQE